MTYGYARISTPKQKIERQIRNILEAYPDAIIIEEVFTGTKINRKEMDKLRKILKKGDRIVFDAPARMSRTEDEGVELYKELFFEGVELIFLNKSHINTSVFKKAMETQIEMTGTMADIILKAVNEYMMRVAEEQIRLAFREAQDEVDNLHRRTRQGIETARLNGKRIGASKGDKFNVKKKAPAKEKIKKLARDFGGTLSDQDTMKVVGLSRNTYYNYKREIIEELYY